MSAKSRMAVVALLSAAVITAFTPMTFSADHGGGGRGGGGGGGGEGRSSFSGGGGGGGRSSGGWSGGSGGSRSGWSGGGGARVESGGRAPQSFRQPSQVTPRSGTGGWSGQTFGRGDASRRAYDGSTFSRSDRWDHGNWSGRSGDWDRGRNWSGHRGDWDHGSSWRGWSHRGWWPGYSYSWWPGYAYGWRGYGYPYYGYYGYAPYYGYDGYAGAAPYTAAYGSDDVTSGDRPIQGDYASQAAAAFRRGDYRDAARLAGHASIDDPRNANVHLLLSLALFATGDYRGAAMEAHAVAALGNVPDWATVYGIYGNLDAYTDHLRALETYVRENPDAPEGRFILGFQYMIAGHRDAARTELTEAVKLEPNDRLATQLLVQVGGRVPGADTAEPQEPRIPDVPQPGSRRPSQLPDEMELD